MTEPTLAELEASLAAVEERLADIAYSMPLMDGPGEMIIEPTSERDERLALIAERDRLADVIRSHGTTA